MTLKRIFSLLAALALILCTGAAMAEEEEGIIFDATGYISGIAGLDLAPHKGKVMALFFYTATSEDCVAQLPAWKLIYDDFDRDELEVILIHAWDGEGQTESDEVKELCGLEGMHIYEDEDARLSQVLGVTEYPNTLFLDKEGTPASGYGGRLNYTTIAEFLVSLGATQLQNSYVNP